MAKIAKQEGVHTIYNENGELLAILKRDDKTGKHLAYRVTEANCVDLVELISETMALDSGFDDVRHKIPE